MRDWWPRLLILALLAGIVGLPLFFRPVGASDASASAGDPSLRLIIITPNNEQIRYEIARAFNAWRQSQGKPQIEFDWRTSGGTSDLRRQILSQYEKAAQQGVEDRGVGIDLFFGGGDFEHDKLANGVTITRGGQKVKIPVTVSLDIPSDLFAAAFPEPDIGGARLYHPEKRWVATALSSFGIVYNRDVLKIIGADEPQTWSDLKDGRFARNVALADPGHSGSIATTYDAVLRRVGWTEGWAMLRRVFANARYFTDGAGKVPVDVSAGEAAAGMCIDFYGRFQAGAVGGNRVGYVDPAGMTAITADPISLLLGAPHPDLAREFILWLLRPEAQNLWQRRIGTPDGPALFELRRQPIRRDLYTPQNMATWTDQIDPFTTARPFPDGMPDYYATIAPVAHAMAIDIHADMQAAWQAIYTHPQDARHARMLALFDAMPPELTLTWPDRDLAEHWLTFLEHKDHPRHKEAAAVLAAFTKRLDDRYSKWTDADRLLDDRQNWTIFFRDNYRQIVEMAGE